MGKFKIGDRVRISPDSEYYKSGREYNPIDVSGEIVDDCRNKSTDYSYTVLWDNGEDNGYRESDLVLDTSSAEALLEEARRRFKPGCKYRNTSGHGVIQSKDTHTPYIHEDNPVRIAMAEGMGLIYDGRSGKWGEVVEEPYKHPYDNCVIEVLDMDHGKKVIEWWKGVGVRTGGLSGSCTKENNSDDRSYGLCNGVFDNFDKADCIHHNLKIITLTEQTKAIINSQIKTKTNGNTESGKTVKVQRVDLQIRKGSIGRRAGLKGSGVEISIGNRHRDYKTRSIRG